MLFPTSGAVRMFLSALVLAVVANTNLASVSTAEQLRRYMPSPALQNRQLRSANSRPVGAIVYSDSDNMKSDGICADSDYPAECLPITSCSNVKRQIEAEKSPPEICGWEGNMPFVCCQNTVAFTSTESASRPSTTNSYRQKFQTTAGSTFAYSDPTWDRRPVTESGAGNTRNILNKTPQYAASSAPSSLSKFFVEGELPAYIIKTTSTKVPYTPPLKIHIAPPPPPVESTFSVYKICGKTSSDQNRNIGPWPWLVTIHSNGDDDSSEPCVGALISNFYVLTTASCIVSIRRQYNQPHLLIGEFPENSTHPRTTVDTVKIHPFYDGITLDSYDVALIRSSAPLKSTPICLPDPGETIESLYGNTVTSLNVPKLENQEDNIITSNQECLRRFIQIYNEKIPTIPDNFVCILDNTKRWNRSNQSRSCVKIAGSLLMTENKRGQWMLIGLKGRHTAGCYHETDESMPVIVSAVIPHLDWISANSNLP